MRRVTYLASGSPGQERRPKPKESCVKGVEVSTSPSPKLGARAHLPRLDWELVVELTPLQEAFWSEYVGLGVVLGIAVHTPEVDEHCAALWNGVGDAFMLIDIILGRRVGGSYVLWYAKEIGQLWA